MGKIYRLIIVSIVSALFVGCQGMGFSFSAHFPLNSQIESEREKQSTVVYISRHAEKRKDQGKDPDLSDEGQQQAMALADALSTVKLDVIYSTPYKRTMQTALPTANRQNLSIISEYIPAKEFAALLVEKHKHQRILVVGHSNTVPELISALGVEEKVEIGHEQYGDLFRVVVTNHQPAKVMFTQSTYE